MEHSFNTPQRALRSTAARSTSWHTATPDQQQLGVRRESIEARSPAPRYPTSSSSPDAAPRGSSAVNRSTPSSHSHNVADSSQHQPPQQQPRRQPDLFHSRGQRSKREVSDAAPSHQPHSRSSGGGGEAEGGSWRQRSTVASAVSPNQASRPPRKSSPSGNSPDEDRRRCQRDKQIHFGYATDGYVNMERLIRHDPLLRSGGLLPLSPPAVVKGSKRIWDIQLRKWRRALHMFDYVFIDGEDDPSTRATVLEEQRQQWVSEAYQGTPRDLRKRISLEELRRVQHTAAVPTKIPVEEDLRCLLRREDCYESVRSVVPQSASSLTKGTDISPLEAGIKIHIAPSSAVLQRQQAQLELQQRLTSLQQQQQQQQKQQQQSTVSAEAAVNKTPPRESSAPSPPPSMQPSQPRRSGVLSPSPRRPLLTLPHDAQAVDVAMSQQQQQPSRRRREQQQSPHPTTGGSAEAIAVASCSGGACEAPGFSSASATSAAFLSDTTGGGTASQPALFSSIHTSLGRMFGESSASAAAVQPSPSPPTAAAVAPSFPPPPLPPPFSAVTTASVPSFFAGPPSVHSSAVSGAVAGMYATVPTPWGPAAVFVDPAAVAVPLSMTMMLPAMPSEVSAAPLEPAGLGRLSGSLHHAGGHPPSLERMAEPHTPSAAAMGRDGHRRSGGGSGAPNTGGTPQTVPRFVSRLSTSPSEQRLGEQRQYRTDREREGRPQPHGAAAVSQRTSQSGVTDRCSVESPSAATSKENAEKSPSFSDMTPERTLFGGAATAATAAADAQTEGRRMERRGDSLEESERDTAAKGRTDVDGEGPTFAPLNFETEAN